MLSYYLTAVSAFSVGFLVAAVFKSGRRAQTDYELTWLNDEITAFAEKCRSRTSNGDYLVAQQDLEGLEKAAATANPQAK